MKTKITFNDIPNTIDRDEMKEIIGGAGELTIYKNNSDGFYAGWGPLPVVFESGISGDFLSQDIRECMHFLGEITGQISNDEILGNIFSKFCIGK